MSNNKNYGNQNYNKGGKKPKYDPLQNLAYNMGKVQRGLKGDTKVADSYNAGLKGTETKKQKPLC